MTSNLVFYNKPFYDLSLLLFVKLESRKLQLPKGSPLSHLDLHSVVQPSLALQHLANLDRCLVIHVGRHSARGEWVRGQWVFPNFNDST